MSCILFISKLALFTVKEYFKDNIQLNDSIISYRSNSIYRILYKEIIID